MDHPLALWKEKRNVLMYFSNKVHYFRTCMSLFVVVLFSFFCFFTVLNCTYKDLVLPIRMIDMSIYFHRSEWKGPIII